LNARVWLLAASLVLAAPFDLASKALAQDDASLQTMLIARIQGRLDALASGDRAPWKGDLDPNALIVDEEGHVRTPSAFLAWLSPLPSGSSGTLRVTDVHFARSNDAAVVAFVAREHESIYDARFFARFSFVDTYHERDGRWMLVSEQQTRLQLDPPTVALHLTQLRSYVGRYRMAGAPYIFEVSIVRAARKAPSHLRRALTRINQTCFSVRIVPRCTSSLSTTGARRS
jgi:hypothetical protein